MIEFVCLILILFPQKQTTLERKKEKKSLHFIGNHKLTLPKRQSLDTSKLKDIPNDNLKLDENNGKFSERVEYAVEKGAIYQTKSLYLFTK